MLDRRVFLLATASSALISRPVLAKVPWGPHVLLVCQFGTVKSPIARELLKRRAAERGITLSASARGITPQEHITPDLVRRLAKDGINPAAEPLRQLRPSDIASADLVIAFDKLPPEYHPRRIQDWSDLPSMVSDYDHARAVLDARIEALLDTLAGR